MIEEPEEHARHLRRHRPGHRPASRRTGGWTSQLPARTTDEGWGVEERWGSNLIAALVAFMTDARLAELDALSTEELRRTRVRQGPASVHDVGFYWNLFKHIPHGNEDTQDGWLGSFDATIDDVVRALARGHRPRLRRVRADGAGQVHRLPCRLEVSIGNV